MNAPWKPEPLPRWDGRWTVEPPADYVRGLYRLHQIEARDLLSRHGRTLDEWEASILQVVALQSKPLTDAQKYWLRRIGNDHGEGDGDGSPEV